MIILNSIFLMGGHSSQKYCPTFHFFYSQCVCFFVILFIITMFLRFILHVMKKNQIFTNNFASIVHSLAPTVPRGASKSLNSGSVLGRELIQRLILMRAASFPLPSYQLYVKVSLSLCIQCTFSPSLLFTSPPALMSGGLMALHIHSVVDIM